MSAGRTVAVDPRGQASRPSPYGLAEAAEVLAARSELYGAALYRPRSSGRRILSDDHPVEGEARATAVHPADTAMEQERFRMRVEEAAAWQRLWYRATQTEHLVEAS
jgi:hypothetical protein